MLREITLGQYYPAKSILHSLDPRVKLFSTLVFIINLSIGTLVIVGLHYPIVSLVNFALEHLFNIDNICYQWYEALIISLGISALLYPVILYGKKRAPLMIGHRS